MSNDGTRHKITVAETIPLGRLNCFRGDWASVIRATLDDAARSVCLTASTFEVLEGEGLLVTVSVEVLRQPEGPTA